MIVEMQSGRRWLFVSAVVLLTAAVAALWSQLQSHDDVYARALIDAARQKMAASERLNRLPLAEREFARALEALDRAESLRLAGQLTELVSAAEWAMSLTDDAQSVAEARRGEAQAAELKDFSGSVVHRSAKRVSWVGVIREMSLFHGDRIATEASSSAVLRFGAGNEVRVEADSIVVIRGAVKRRADDHVDLDLKLSRGILDSMPVDVEARGALVVADLEKADIVIDSGVIRLVRVDVLPSLDAPIAVVKGRASIEAPTGETIVLEPTSYTIVSPGGEASAAKPLPGRPRTLSPVDGATLYVSRDRPEIVLRWESDGCERVRVELASDRAFEGLLYDQTLQSSALSLPELSPGEYFWRLRCLDLAALQGVSEELPRFAIIGDNESPRLEILQPSARVTTETVVARCRTEPSLRVFINGEPASELESGIYGRRIKLAPGINRIVFEALDGAGNAGRARRFVTRVVN